MTNPSSRDSAGMTRDDSEIELGNLGHKEPAAESDSTRAQLLHNSMGGGTVKKLMRDASEASKSGAAAPVLSYCLASILMTVINKVC